MPRRLLSMALRAVHLLTIIEAAAAFQPAKLAFSPFYNGRDPCPSRCVDSGAVSGNWSVYHNLDQLESCKETIFYDFSLYDPVDEPDLLHRIYACTTYGPDWLESTAPTPKLPSVASVNATFSVSWLPDQDAKLGTSSIQSLAGQMRHYLENGNGITNNTLRLYARVDQAAIGVYIGAGYQNEAIGSSVLQAFNDYIRGVDVATRSVTMQLCGGDFQGNHTLGVIATSNGSFGAIQNAFKTWGMSQCLSFVDSKNVIAEVALSAPFNPLHNTTANGTFSPNASQFASQSIRRGVTRASLLASRGECRTLRVAQNDGCPEMAVKCGISGYDFMQWNSADGFCHNLNAGQAVCCSPGTLPDIRPKPNADGTCSWYTVNMGESCSNIAAANGLTVQNIEDFNKNTWGWNGCEPVVWAGIRICLSTGRPPMPAPVSNTVCGPQVPGTAQLGDGTDLASLNPCPLNACCDVWGQCGTTDEFCVDTSTGAPGTARKGTNGCISNCGSGIKVSNAPAVFRKVGYFEGYNLKRSCLNQDASQIDASQYTHLHFAFGTITPDFTVNTGDLLTTYEFNKFKQVQGPKRIISFGGWDFSTGPDTYTIFRDGVTGANRQKLATNIASFVKDNNLDGVDIDWEYPGASDIPNIPPASAADGLNYLRFLISLKALLPGKSVSIAAPASYWYLRGFPVAEMSSIVDYIVYMTYDLHGQWDADNKWSQPGCPSGHCLRSGVNLTETINSLAMITKAGMPSNKVVVGVTSYGRSHGMAQAGCYTEECLFTGGPLTSTATKGPCTDTAGYISNAEIQDIINTPSRVNFIYVDKSNSDILVYDNTQWVSWMSPETKAKRTILYQLLQMGGTSDWAIDLQSYHLAPGFEQPNPGSGGGDSGGGDKGWPPYKKHAATGGGGGGGGPSRGPRTGNWTKLGCNDRAVWDWDGMTQKQRWEAIDAPDAYADVVRQWKTYDSSHGYEHFSVSVLNTLHGPDGNKCDELGGSCQATTLCTDFIGEGTGPAGYFLYNSFVLLHRAFQNIHDALHAEANTRVNYAIDSFIDKFAPLPPEDDNKWLFFILDLITLGATAGMGKVFNSWLKNIPYFTKNPETLANVKDTTMAILSGGGSIAHDLYSNPTLPGWTLYKQHDFKLWVGQVVLAISAINSLAVGTLFNGSDYSVGHLANLMSDGKLIPGSDGNNKVTIPDFITGEELGKDLATVIFGYSIPVVWRLSGRKPFILDSGSPCDTKLALGVYLTQEMQDRTRACYNGNLYFLVMPDGQPEHCVNGCSKSGCTDVCRPNPFSAPPGIEYLSGKDDTFGEITVEKIIQGSVKTYIQNGNVNGGDKPDVLNRGTAGDLMDMDITTPGFFRIPVCSGEMAHKGWGNTLETDDLYPCLVPPK